MKENIAREEKKKKKTYYLFVRVFPKLSYDLTICSALLVYFAQIAYYLIT